jgi:hypothetical protein
MAGAGWPPRAEWQPGPGGRLAWPLRPRWPPGPPVLARLARPSWPAWPARPGPPAGRIAPRRHMAQRSVRSNVMLWMVLWSAVSTRRISLMRT